MLKSSVSVWISLLVCLVATKSVGVQYKILDPLDRANIEETFTTEKPNTAIALARGEAEGFHLVVQGRIDACDLEVTNWIPAEGNEIDVTLYREHFIQTQRPSYRSETSVGSFPDALIPFVNPFDGSELTGARFDAKPYYIPFKETAAYWIEFSVPFDLEAGNYSCGVIIKDGNTVLHTLTVSVIVWAFEIPKRPHVRGEFGYGGTKFNQLYGISNASVAERAKIYDLFLRNLVKHRLMVYRPYMTTGFTLNRETGEADWNPVIDLVRFYLDTLQANSLLIPFSGTYPWNSILSTNREKAIKYLRDTYDFFAINGWEQYIYTYIIDEPNRRDGFRVTSKGNPATLNVKNGSLYIVDDKTKTIVFRTNLDNERFDTIGELIEALKNSGLYDVSNILYSTIVNEVHTLGTLLEQKIDISAPDGGIVEVTEYEAVRQYAALVHEANPNIRYMCTEQAAPEHEEWGDLYGSVDIWCPLFALYKDEYESQRLAAGEELWCYTALCQGKAPRAPFWQIDFPLLEYRVPFWVAYRFGITGMLYWHTTYWEQSDDVWTNPETYGIDNTLPYNGEGSLYYPGVDVGYMGPVESLRLKALRDGEEDYEYLYLADSLGLDVSNYLNLVGKSWSEWSQNPQDIYNCRRQLGEMIHQSYISSLPEKDTTLLQIPSIVRGTIKVNSPGELQLFDLSGRVVIHKPINALETIYLDNVPSGVYYLSFSTAKNLMQKKIVVIKDQN